MLIKKKKSYEISENEVTPHSTYLNRRSFMKGVGAIAGGSLLAACRPARPDLATQPPPPTAVPTAAPSTNAGEAAVAAPTAEAVEAAPAILTTDELGDAFTSFEEITTYNNFYEFTTDKRKVAQLSKDFVTNPWQVEIGGMVNKPGTYDLDFFRGFDQQERIYRMRCVEAWSMVIPWVGFPLAELLAQVEPTADAKYVMFETLTDEDQFPGTRGIFGGAYDWPYTEGLRLDEAMNDLTLMATGIYGQDLLPQNGAPIRLVVPWKYGFKSIKSIVSIQLVAEEPKTLWNTANAREYGFYSNVNPEVSHPRWSQASERRIGELGRRPTLMFNGYAEQVASLYDGMDLAEFF